MTREIIIEKRHDDFIAYLKGNREIWGCGKTYDEAIGNMIKTRKEKFDIEITYPKIVMRSESDIRWI